MGSADRDYQFRTFTAEVDAEGHATPATRDWVLAETQGFHEAKPSDAVVDRTAANMAADGRRLTGVYAEGGHPAGLDAGIPVATFASFEQGLNVGGPEPVTAHLISDVTVRPTHRRRGLLRRMMTADLQTAKDEGCALAALTVSEAGIYRRFGFGVATLVHAVEVATDARFRLLVQPAGEVELIDPHTVGAVGREVFAAFHAAHPGSVDRHHGLWDRMSGLHGDDGTPDARMRAAAHYDGSGTVDGYVSYRVGDWETKPGVLEVVDLVAATTDAYLGLWEFLASVDLVKTVTWGAAPAEDPLRWALDDWRVVRTTGLDDWLWLRVLDVAKAFEARGYRSDGETVIAVSDPLGHAEGVFRVTVVEGSATVTAVSDDAAQADLSCDASVLASLYLGGVDPRMLVAAGRLDELSPGAAQRLSVLLAPVAPVYGITHF